METIIVIVVCVAEVLELGLMTEILHGLGRDIWFCNYNYNHGGVGRIIGIGIGNII